MAKKKKTQNQSTTPETDPITTNPDLHQQEQGGAPPEMANPVGEVVVPANHVGEVAEPNLPDVIDAGAVADPSQVNDVDTTPPEPGTSFAEFFVGVLDATVEEPTYPAHEWQAATEPPLVLPDHQASNEALIEGARRLVQIVSWRMRRSVQEWWLIGRHLAILKSRPENEGRWRKEILPQIGVNHTTDHQLRAIADRITFERSIEFNSKYEALKSIGFFAAPQPKQIEVQAHADGNGEVRLQGGAEGIFGIGSEAAYEFGGVEDGPFTQSVPFEDTPNQFGAEVEPLAGIVADEAAHPATVADAKSQPKADGKTPPQADAKKTAAKAHPQPEAKKVAAKAAPQPEEDDPIAGTEALVITLSGAEVADMEAAAAESGLTLLAKTKDQIVGLLWYADDPHKVATEKVGKALAKLRPVKKKFKVEARCLGFFDSITV